MSVPFPPEIEQVQQEAVQTALQDMQGQQMEAEESQANAAVQPNPPKDLEHVPLDEQGKMLAAALYGDDFPLINSEEPDDADWASWARGRWAHHRAAVEKHLHLIERNRLFRMGQQWVSSRGRGPWREPMKPTDSARVVYNLIDKALDQRLQIITDQRPGFTVNPMTLDPQDKRKAEARQMALDYQYDQQQMDQVGKESAFWAQTDGVSFKHTFWDSEKGPWDERMGENGERKPLGDLRTVVQRVEQVRVSANATSTVMPYYYVIREVIPATEAAYRYGLSGVQDKANTMPVTGMGDIATDAGMNRWVLDQTLVGEGDRLRNQDVVERYTLYVDRHPDILPNGLQMVIVGDAVVWGPGPLLFGVIPVQPVRDGSTDPSFYPRPIMEQWIDHQVRINALLSKWVDSVRVNSTGRFLARPGAIAQETFVGGGTSVLEINGVGSLDDVIRPVNGFSVGQDVKDLLQLEIKAFEDASGYNDVSRGQIASDASGRAILAAREQLERVFAPPVQALARAFTGWAKIQLAGMAFGYDVPRDLGTVGNGRPDLARELVGDDFDGQADVKVEANTLMPMPEAYRRFVLDSYLERGLITPQQYMRNEKFASIKNLNTPDEDQDARAKRIADAIRTKNPNVPPIRWQDNEAIHQDVLEREILLQDDLDPDVIQTAQMRWTQLASQAQMKQGGAPIGAPAPNANGGEPNSPFAPSPVSQPLLGSLPSGLSAQPPQGIGSDQDFAANQFEQMAPQ